MISKCWAYSPIMLLLSIAASFLTTTWSTLSLNMFSSCHLVIMAIMNIWVTWFGCSCFWSVCNVTSIWILIYLLTTASFSLPPPPHYCMLNISCINMMSSCHLVLHDFQEHLWNLFLMFMFRKCLDRNIKLVISRSCSLLHPPRSLLLPTTTRSTLVC